MQRIAQAVFDVALILGRLHVDEVDHHQATQIAQPQLAGDFVGGFEVGVERGGFDVRALGGAGGVDVDRDQGLGVVDDDRAAGGQLHLARVGGFDLVFDLEAREQRHVVAVELDPGHVARHHVPHELARLLEDGFVVDQQLADIGLKVVADGADDERALLVDEEGAALLLGGVLDGGPELEQVAHVPVELFDAAADAGGAGDDAHALGHFELGDGVAQFVAVFAFHSARDTAAARVVGHQHHVAAGQADVGSECRAFGAAFVFVDLDDQFLPLTHRILNAGTRGIDAIGKELLADFLERQEAVAIGAIFDEGRFEAGFYPGDDPLVDVALALFLAGGFDVEVDQLLTIDDGDANFFLLRRVKQHALHWVCSPALGYHGISHSGRYRAYRGRLLSV